VREFASVIERAAIRGDGRRLEVARALGVAPPAVFTPPPRETPEPAAENGLASFTEATRRHIESALRRCHGRVEGPFGAARLLEINPHTLRSKMRKLGIEAGRYREGG
jgi:transcriptional regulator with GAF, ATPase, and Fis domain